MRDYIHVEDLAAGHVAALTALGRTDEPVSTWNLGTGHGTSVSRCCTPSSRPCGRELPYEVVDRRPGDIAGVVRRPVAAPSRARLEGQRTIDDMCADTWRWQAPTRTATPTPEGGSAHQVGPAHDDVGDVGQGLRARREVGAAVGHPRGANAPKPGVEGGVPCPTPQKLGN